MYSQPRPTPLVPSRAYSLGFMLRIVHGRAVVGVLADNARVKPPLTFVGGISTAGWRGTCPCCFEK